MSMGQKEESPETSEKLQAQVAVEELNEEKSEIPDGVEVITMPRLS